MICLDNDVLRKYARPDPDPSVVQYLSSHSSENWILLAVPDLFVAATARSAGATLATANRNDFDKAPVHELIDVDIVPVAEDI